MVGVSDSSEYPVLQLPSSASLIRMARTNPRPAGRASRAVTARPGAPGAPATPRGDETPGVVTVRTIAARLDLSKSTVAAAFRGQSPHAATAAQVKAMAEALGSRPSPSPLVTASMMRVRQTRGAVSRGKTLGYLSAVPRSELLQPDCPVREGYIGARERARELGLGLDLLEYSLPGIPAARLRTVICNRGILGFIIAPHTQPQIELELGWEEFATVCIGFSVSVVPGAS